MLVLSRKAGEMIRVGNEVKLRVTRIHGNRVVLGIEAPKHMKITRGELPPLQAIDIELEEAPAA